MRGTCFGLGVASITDTLHYTSAGRCSVDVIGLVGVMISAATKRPGLTQTGL